MVKCYPFKFGDLYKVDCNIKFWLFEIFITNEIKCYKNNVMTMISVEVTSFKIILLQINIY